MYADIAEIAMADSAVSMRASAAPLRPPTMGTPPAGDEVDRWVAFELERPQCDVYAYVDAENVIKTVSMTAELRWPPRATCADLIALVTAMCGEWISAAAGVSSPKIGWVVYSKRAIPDPDAQGVAFAVSATGEYARDGDELDDILCVSATCARIRAGGTKVCLVSGDEMRWTSLCNSIKAEWGKVDRGPRDAPSEGNRLVHHVLSLRKRCGGTADEFIRCLKQPPAPEPPTAEPPPVQSPRDVSNDMDPGATASEAAATVPTHAYSGPASPAGYRTSVFGDAAGTTIILTASLLALTLTLKI
jgi:hypothetical protein